MSKSYFLSGYLYSVQNTSKWSAWQTYTTHTQYTRCICCVIVERTPYTPVITDITFNPFGIVKNFPLFSALSQSYAQNGSYTHLHCSMLTGFGAKQYGYYMDTAIFSCSSTHFENDFASFYRSHLPLWID